MKEIGWEDLGKGETGDTTLGSRILKSEDTTGEESWKEKKEITI